ARQGQGPHSRAGGRRRSVRPARADRRVQAGDAGRGRALRGGRLPRRQARFYQSERGAVRDGAARLQRGGGPTVVGGDAEAVQGGVAVTGGGRAQSTGWSCSSAAPVATYHWRTPHGRQHTSQYHT